LIEEERERTARKGIELSWKEESFDFVGREVKKSKEDDAWTAIEKKRRENDEKKR